MSLENSVHYSCLRLFNNMKCAAAIVIVRSKNSNTRCPVVSFCILSYNKLIERELAQKSLKESVGHR